jgi:hypothetical protein
MLCGCNPGLIVECEQQQHSSSKLCTDTLPLHARLIRCGCYCLLQVIAKKCAAVQHQVADLLNSFPSAADERDRDGAQSMQLDA